MKIKLSIYILSLGLILGCGKQEEGNTTLQELKNNRAENLQEVVHSVSYLDSINNLSAKIGDLKSSQEAKRQLIDALTKKKDSVTTLLAQVQQSLEQVNAKKIAPGIEGVNTKLAELKGQRENAKEQLDLQKQEIVLAEKKIGLLNEEKTVYDAQHKALWNRGAEPNAFTVVDSLLAGLNAKISEQTLRVKSLKSTITDIEEQMVSIDDQSKSLSSKIRNNYTAKQIFDDYSKEEKDRLQNQLVTIEADLKILADEDSSLSDLLNSENSKKSAFENEQNASRQLAILNEKKRQEEANAQINAELEKNQEKSKGKKSAALFIVGILAALFLLFFLLGKMRKARLSKQD